MKIRLSSLTIPLAMIFSLIFLGTHSNALGQEKLEKEKPVANVDAEDWTDEGSVLGFDKETSERLLSSLRKGAFSKNASVAFQSLKMFSEHPELHQGLGEGVQLELVKQAIKQDFTFSLGFNILLNSEIGGIEREELLLKVFKKSLSDNSEISWREVINQLSAVSETLISRFALEIDKDPLGDHTDKLLVIEHLGPAAKKALPALLKRYRALKELAVKEGRAANYMDVLFAVGEIRSQDGMEIILDAINERGSKEREQYALVGFECLNRMVDTPKQDRIFEKYLEYAQALIKKFDKDSDGFLSKDEVAKMHRPANMGFDRNNDNKMSAKELALSYADQKTTRSRSSSSKSSSRSRNRRSELIRNSVGAN